MPTSAADQEWWFRAALSDLYQEADVPRTFLVVLRVVVSVLCTTLCFSGPLLAQRSDRATISGVVTDPQGSPVPGATVTVHNQETGVDTVRVTNEAGAYTSPPLVLGRYVVSVDLQGFKKALSSEILLQGGDAVRHDVALQVGALTETVEVKSSEGLSDTRPGRQPHRQREVLPRPADRDRRDVRLAESVLQMQPGYLPMKPNGDPMFRGSQFNSRINGGQTMATENFFDGAAFGYASGHQQSQESTPPVDAVQEVKVITTSYSAQYGHTSGGFIEYTAKSGTNAYHGSGYGYFADDAFNAKGFFAVGKTPLSNNDYGVTLGGPLVIPNVYDGHNKTFFFTNFDYTRLRSGVLPGFGNTTPIDAFKARRLQCAADGEPDWDRRARAADSMPARSSIPVPRAWSTAYRCATRIPGTSSRPTIRCAASVAAKIAALMVQPDRPRHGVQRRRQPGRRPDMGAECAQHPGARRPQLLAELPDQPQLLLESAARRSATAAASAAARRSSRARPSRQKNNTYIGEGFYQRISTHHAHQQFDWIIRNNLLNHSTVAWDRWFMGGNSLSAGVGLAAAALGRQPGRPARQHRGPAGVHLRRQHSLQHRRTELAELRLREERPLAVLGRSHLGQGQAHGEVRRRVSTPHLPEPRMGDQHRRAIRFQSR